MDEKIKWANFQDTIGTMTGERNLSEYLLSVVFTPQPLRAVGVLFSPMVSGWAGGGK